MTGDDLAPLLAGDQHAQKQIGILRRRFRKKAAMVLLVVSEQHRQPLFVFLPREHLNDVLIAPHAPAVNLSPWA